MANTNVSGTREAVLNEICELLEGCHPTCQSMIGRFLRDQKLQQASELLASAIQAEGHPRQRATSISPPPGWLLPA